MSNPAAENSVAGKPLDSLTREEALAELRAVREREANLRSMIEAFRDVAYRIHWPTRSFRYISPASHSMLGFGFEEIVEMTPKGFFRRIHPDDKPRFRHFFGLFVKSQPGRTVHSRTSYRWRRKDGEHIWVQDMRNLLYDANGAPEFIVGSLRDITETRLVRMELQQSEERYRDLIELSPLGIAEIDTEGIVRFCNKGMGQMQGEAPERLIGLPIWDFLSPRENKAALEALIRRLVADMPPPEPFYCENMACDGRLYRVRVDWAYKRDSGGRCGGFIAMATDITEAQRSSESLERRDAILESVSFAARRFIGVDNWETCAQEVLANLGRGAQVDRVCLYERLEPANPETVISLRFEWNSEAFSFMRGNPVLKRFPMRARGFGRWADEMLADRIVSGATRSLPEPESAFLARQGILSIAAAPIRIGSEWWGIVVFDDCMREREWSAAEIEAIRAASGLFSAAIRSTFAARALRNAEIRFREMIQSIPVGLYRTTPGPEGRHLMANPALARLFGYDDPEELLHVPVAAMYANPCERKAFSDKLLRQGHVAAEPMKLKKRDGATIWCALTAKTICDEAGNPLYFDGMVEDISEQKRMEESLRHSERMARSLMDAFPEPAMLVDPRGGIIAANRAATLEMRRGRAGSSPSAAAQGLPAADAFDWLAPAAAAERQAIFERCLRGRQAIRFENVRDGPPLPAGGASASRTFDTIMHPLLDAAGEVEQVAIFDFDITERKRAVEALRKSEENFRAVVEDQSELICRFRPDGRILFANGALGRFFRRSPGELIGRDYYQFYAEERRDPLRSLLRGIGPSAGAATHEERLRAPDGALRWVEWSTRPFFDPRGALVEFQAVGRDITEHKRIDESLRESETRLRLLLEQAPAILWTMDRDFVFTSSQGLGLKSVRLRPNEVVGMSIWDFFRTTDARFPAVAAHLSALNGKTVRFTQEWAGAFFECLARPLHGADDAVIGVIGVAIDVTEREKAQSQARKSEEVLRTVVEGAPVILALIDAMGSIQFAAGRAMSKFNLAPEDWIGQNVFALHRDKPEALAAIRRALGGTPSSAILADSRGVLEARYFPAHDASETVTGVVGVHLDITERLSLERELLEISAKEQRRIGQDLHDGVNQMLGGIAFMIQALQSKLKSNGRPEAAQAGEIHHLVADALEQTRGMARVLNPVRLEEEGLMSALQELAASVRQFYGVSCVFECDGGAAVSHHEVANHAYRIAQEAVNNAMKHASARRLWIRLAHAGGRVRLCVEDDGVGLRSREGRNEGMGLRIMEYRARLIGAALEIGPRDGGGVRVVCEFSGAPPEIAG